MSEQATVITSEDAAVLRMGWKHPKSKLQLPYAKNRDSAKVLFKLFFFLAGVISILTTIGIVYVLGTELINFFTNLSWEETNKEVATSINIEATTIEVSEGGRSIKEGQLIRLGKSEEYMTVLAVDGQIMTVTAVQKTHCQLNTAPGWIFSLPKK